WMIWKFTALSSLASTVRRLRCKRVDHHHSRSGRTSALPGLEPHEDAATLLAAHDLVLGGRADRRDVARVEVEPTALAARAAEHDRTEAAVLGAQALVEGQERLGDLCGLGLAGGADLARLRVDL